MLDQMRNHTQNWLIYVILGAIILVFAINFGPGFDQLSQTGCGRGKTVAATVNGVDIPRRLYEMQWRNFVRMQRIPTYLRKLYRGQVLDQVISLYLMAQEGQRYGIQISDDEIDEELLKDTSFQRNGIFDKTYFRALISRFRLTPREYKEFIRLRLQAQRMQKLTMSGVSVSDNEVKRDYLNKNSKVQIEYVSFDASKFKKGFKVTVVEAKAYAKKNQKNLKKYYSANLDKFTKAAKVRTRHLILTFKKRGKPTTEEINKLKDKMVELRKQALKNIKGFDALVKKYSQEPGANKSGGLLPWITEGQKGWDPAYVAASFKLKKKGSLSPIVKSSFGYHLIKLEDRQEAVKRPLSKLSVKLEIARILLQQDKAASFIQMQTKQLLEEVKKSKDLASAIKSLTKKLASAKRTVAPVKRAVVPVKRAVAPAKRAVAPAKRAVAPAKRAVAPVKRAVAPVKRAVAPAKRAVAPVKRAVAPAKRAVAPVKRAVAPAKRAVAPVKRAVAPAKRAVAPAKRAVAPAKRAVAPVKRVAAPAKRAVAPAKRAVAPAKRAVAPAARPKPIYNESFAPAARRSAPTARRAVVPVKRAAAPTKRTAVKATKPALNLITTLLLKQQLKVKTTPPFPLDSESIPGIKKVVGAPIYPLIRAAFSLSKKKPWYSKTIKVLNKVYIIRLKKHIPANMKKFGKEKNGYVSQMLTRRQREFQAAWLEQLRKKAKIVKNKKALKSRQY